MQGPQAVLLGEGDRLHLHHGPIDLIIGADADGADGRLQAFEAAVDRFQTILDGLVGDLVCHRRQLSPGAGMPSDPVAQRMYRAVAPFCAQTFVTPMIAVAGAVADEVLAAMCAARPLRRAYVNNGGDIAVHLSDGAEYSVAMAAEYGEDLGRIRFASRDGISGIATSGAKGRSHSLGIADSVTVLASSAAEADVAATLIANAVDLPGHSGIIRQPANDLQPDSDLGDRPVVTMVPALSPEYRNKALINGYNMANRFCSSGHIKSAALFLQGQTKTTGQGFDQPQNKPELTNA